MNKRQKSRLLVSQKRKQNDVSRSLSLSFPSRKPTIRPLADGPDLVAEPAVRRGLLALAGVVHGHFEGP